MKKHKSATPVQLISPTGSVAPGSGASSIAHPPRHGETYTLSGPSHYAIHTTDLRRTFSITGRESHHVQALRGVSLGLPTQSFTAIVGASGSGKTTLMQCIAGLDQPSSGLVHLLGTNTVYMSAARRSRFRAENVGFIFQDHNLVSSLNVFDNVGLPGRLQHRSLSKQTIVQALERVGLHRQARSYPHQLSGGERQRVAVARVLASRPKILFADEPTASLDVVAGAAVLDWLAQARDQGATVLMVTHDSQAAARADSVLVMENGQVVDQVRGGSPETISAAVRAARQRTLGDHSKTHQDSRFGHVEGGESQHA